MNNNVDQFLNAGSMSVLDYDLSKNLGSSSVDKYGYINYKSVDDITYYLNSNFFRSKHFDQFDKSKKNILFSGCSLTFGIGLPDQCTWTSMISKKFNEYESYNSSFFGHSIDIIIKNMMSFIKSFGSPDVIFVCFPEISRAVKNDRGLYRVVNPYLNKTPRDSYDVRKKYNKSYNYSDNLFYFSSLIHMFEAFCKQSNIKLYWTSWSIEDINNFKNINFSNFVIPDEKSNYFNIVNDESFRLEQGKSKCDTIVNENNLPYWSISATKDHPGSCWNKSLADLFIERLDSEIV